MKKIDQYPISYIGASIVILILLGLLIAFGLPNTAEAMIGAIIILFVGVILTLMFIIAAGFSSLKLSDTTQAMGMPEGTIRALIAIFLIVVFVGIGIFIFRIIAIPPDTVTLPGLTKEQIAELARDNIIAEIQQNTQDPATYDVVIRSSISQEGLQLAQQLVSILGTLVVAVAGFYFGARAVAAARGVAELPTLSIISPASSTIELDAKEGTTLGIQVQTTPSGQAINWSLQGDDNKSLTPLKPNEFEYKRGQSPADEVILRFELANDPAIARELKVLKPKEETG